MSEAIGIMNEAYFVGRHELIDWVNNTLKLNISKVEECCTGAIHCQIFDILYPGKMNMAKVNYAAKHEYEYVNNFKLLQDLFTKVDIQHHVPVDRVVKGRYQDNLELLQWVYEVFNRNYTGAEYDPVKRRAKSKGGAIAHVAKKPGSTASSTRAATIKPTARFDGGAKRSPSQASAPAEKPTAKASEGRGEATALNDALSKARKEISELTGVLKELEKERDWYFSKILEVEKLCKEAPSELAQTTLVQQIFDVLYATDSEENAADGGSVGEQQTPAY